MAGISAQQISSTASRVPETFTSTSRWIRATRPDGSGVQFTVTVRIDTPQELQYYRHGGILEYVLRQLLAQGAKP